MYSKAAPVLVLAAVAAAAPQLPPTCTNLPVGFCGGAMVPNVNYTVPAMYGCEGKCKEMNIWCQADKEGKTYEFLYCCGDNCQGFPKKKTCKVEGKEYTVGVAYDLSVTKLNGCEEKVGKFWCLDEKTVVKCTGSECGSKPELTPPPPKVCEKNTPCNACPPVPPKPLPTKPQPKPQCYSDTDCNNGNTRGCELGCVCNLGRCIPSEGFFDPVVPGEEGPKPDPMPEVCTADADCPNGLFCVSGSCGPQAAPGEGPNPDPMPELCAADADCPTGLFCVNGSCGSAQAPPSQGPSFGMGGIVDPSDRPCLEDKDCRSNQVCVLQIGKCIDKVGGSIS